MGGNIKIKELQSQRKELRNQRKELKVKIKELSEEIVGLKKNKKTTTGSSCGGATKEEVTLD